ncbi:MAG: PQQ-dependent sugar dehydrogenase [Chloroflexia bacterium]|nr:PQQ-dependent sugar dehydrogenase [Chloroflexia bacterium]
MPEIPTPPAIWPTAVSLAPRPPVSLSAFQLELETVLGGLEEPLLLANAGDGSGRLFVGERKGLIRIVQEGQLLPEPFLDLTDRVNAVRSEQGLLGLVFHPDYAENGYFFVSYINYRGDTVVNRFSCDPQEPNRADPDSEVAVLLLDQPAANHNGGHLAFGPDGYLYVGAGDGGGEGDVWENAQNRGTFLGAMLRLNIDVALYAVPAANPFVGDADSRPEIWAYGLRNPWRFSFDRQTGDLYIADVGQDHYEEINVQPAGSPGGENYGWPLMEGRHCYPPEEECDIGPWTPPLLEYDHGQGCAVIGGYAYRGQQFPALQGVYLFGDYCSGRIWGAGPDEQGNWRMAELLKTDLRISSFGEDEDGEVYLLGLEDGTLYHLLAR